MSYLITYIFITITGYCSNYYIYMITCTCMYNKYNNTQQNSCIQLMQTGVNPCTHTGIIQVHIQVYTGTHTGIYRYTYRYIQVHIQVYTGTHTGIYRYTYRYIQVHVQVYIQVHIQVYTGTCTYTGIELCIHISTYINCILPMTVVYMYMSGLMTALFNNNTNWSPNTQKAVKAPLIMHYIYIICVLQTGGAMHV